MAAGASVVAMAVLVGMGVIVGEGVGACLPLVSEPLAYQLRTRSEVAWGGSWVVRVSWPSWMVTLEGVSRS